MSSQSWQLLLMTILTSVFLTSFCFTLLGCTNSDSAVSSISSSSKNVPSLSPQIPATEEVDRSLIGKKLWFLAGQGAPFTRNCGHVGIGGNADEATACAITASTEKVPFYVRYDLQGIDSAVSAGFAGDLSGKIYFVEYDSMGWETEGLPKGASVTDNKHIYIEPCPAPPHLRKTPPGRLSCVPPDLHANRNIMSPTLESF